MSEDREREMAVQIGISMPREMLAATGNARLEETIREGERLVLYDFREMRKGSITDDGICRVGVHIEDGSKSTENPSA